MLELKDSTLFHIKSKHHIGKSYNKYESTQYNFGSGLINMREWQV